jgi:hypothetical protein
VCKNLSFYFSSYFEGSPPTGYPYGVMWWGGEIPRYFYVPMFPRKDFLMRWIRKIQKNKKERMPGCSPYSCVLHRLGMPS